MYCILRQLIGSLGSISWDTTITPQDSAGEVGQPLPPCRPTYPKKQRKTGDQRTIIPVFLLLRFRGKKKQQTKKHPGFRSCCVFMKKKQGQPNFPPDYFSILVCFVHHARRGKERERWARHLKRSCKAQSSSKAKQPKDSKRSKTKRNKMGSSASLIAFFYPLSPPEEKCKNNKNHNQQSPPTTDASFMLASWP